MRNAIKMGENVSDPQEEYVKAMLTKINKYIGIENDNNKERNDNNGR